MRATAATVPRRFVLVTPTARTELPALKDAGFTGYLVKPVRAASLAARMASGDSEFERPGDSAETSSDATPKDAAKGLAILVAEDNEINALLARSLLTRLGHRPTIATNGDAAVDAWLSARDAGEPYAIVLMDVHMPGSDGIEATRRIREAEAGGPRTPIVALTANAFEEDRDACIAAGMDGFLTKPLDRERLATALATAADAKAMAAYARRLPARPNPAFPLLRLDSTLPVHNRVRANHRWRDHLDRNATAEASSAARLSGHHGDVPILLEGRRAIVRDHLVRLRARIREPGPAGLAGLFVAAAAAGLDAVPSFRSADLADAVLHGAVAGDGMGFVLNEMFDEDARRGIVKTRARELGWLRFELSRPVLVAAAILAVVLPARGCDPMGTI